MFLDIPDIVFGDWWSVQAAVNQIRFRLGTDATPTYTGLTLSGLTASTLIGTNANKALESVTIGTGLDYTRPTLSLSHLGIESLTDPNADRILFWDDGETACKWLTVSTGLQISTTNITTKDSEIVHDNLSGFVADEHIAHSGVTLTAGTGLTGGGDITANRTFAVDGVLEDLDTLGVSTADGEFLVATGAGALAWESGATARTSIGLGSVEDTALSTWAGTTNITTLGTIATGTWEGTSISTTYTDAKCTDATADNTAANETSHSDVLVDGEFSSAGLMYTDGAASYSIKAIGTDVQAYHANLAAIAGGTWTGAASITTLGTIATGTWEATDVGIAHGGTGQSTQQAAIDALTNVSAATNEHVLTKDTATGNAIFKAAGVGTHAILDGSVHTDSVADDVTRGSIIYGNATPKWDELVLGAANTFLGSDGTDLSYRTAAQVMASLSGAAAAAFDLNGQDLTNGGVIFLTEQAAAEADVGGKGQIWTKTVTPNQLWFTNDAGTDLRLDAGAWGTWTPTWGGFSSDPTGGNALYIQIGKLVFAVISGWAGGTSNATTFTVTLPVNAKRANSNAGLGGALDNSAWGTSPGRLDTRASSNVADCYKDIAGASWTASGAKVINMTLLYEAE